MADCLLSTFRSRPFMEATLSAKFIRNLFVSAHPFRGVGIELRSLSCQLDFDCKQYSVVYFQSYNMEQGNSGGGFIVKTPSGEPLSQPSWRSTEPIDDAEDPQVSFNTIKVIIFFFSRHFGYPHCLHVDTQLSAFSAFTSILKRIHCMLHLFVIFLLFFYDIFSIRFSITSLYFIMTTQITKEGSLSRGLAVF